MHSFNSAISFFSLTFAPEHNQENILMIRRQTITLLLLFVSLLTLAVPVMPHHHHADGNICLQHDSASLPAGSTSHASHSHCCHNQGCVATHYFQRTPVVRQHVSADQAQRLVTDFAMFFLKQDIALDSYQFYSYSPYIESLHGTYIVHAKGRRAPPAF